MQTLRRPLGLFTSLMIVLSTTAMAAIGATGGVQPATAVVRLHARGTYDMQGRVVRCERGETVGIWVESRLAFHVTNGVVEGCEVGILVTRGAADEAPDEGAPAKTSQVAGMRVRGATIGVWLAGSGSTASENIVGEADYGFVVTGDDNRLTNNQSTDNHRDGILVTGDRNVLEGNEVRRNQGVGIHVASMAPMIGSKRALLFIQDRGLSNVLRENIAESNTLDLREFAEDCDGNEWTQNTFETREPECIQ
jgi:parallel beta-helix repeat protein